MPHGNNAKQLPPLPGKGCPAVGPQFIGPARVALGESHDPSKSVNVGCSSSVVNSISFTLCPLPHPVGAVQEASFTLIGRLTVVCTRPFFGSIVASFLTVSAAVALFAAWGQLPLLLTQAQDKSTLAKLVTQTSVVPNPLTSTLTLNGVVPHEKSLTLSAARQDAGAPRRPRFWAIPL